MSDLASLYSVDFPWDQAPSIAPALEGKSMDELLPGIGVPESKKLEIPEVSVIKPYSYGMAIEINTYPNLSAVLAAESPAEEGHEAEHTPERQALKEENFEKLEVESPEQFGIKYRGMLENLAEEKDIGFIQGYSFRTNKIEVIGEDKILLLDYDLKPLDVRDIHLMPYDTEEGFEGELEPEQTEEEGEE